MIVEKDEKSFLVKENVKTWTVTRKESRLTIDYSVPKDMCADEAALRKYIDENDLF